MVVIAAFHHINSNTHSHLGTVNNLLPLAHTSVYGDFSEKYTLQMNSSISDCCVEDLWG